MTVSFDRGGPLLQQQESRALRPGLARYQRTDSLTVSKTLDVSFALFNVSELAIESLMLGKPDPSTGEYVVLSGPGTIRGWIKAQQYYQGDTLRNVFDIYVSAKVKPAKMANKLIMVEMDCKVLFSALASGTATLGA